MDSLKAKLFFENHWKIYYLHLTIFILVVKIYLLLIVEKQKESDECTFY